MDISPSTINCFERTLQHINGVPVCPAMQDGVHFIGDVVLKTPEGRYIRLFNAFRDKTDPLNTHGVPEGFERFPYDLEIFKTSGQERDEVGLRVKHAPEQYNITPESDEGGAVFYTPDIPDHKFMNNYECLPGYVITHLTAWKRFAQSLGYGSLNDEDIIFVIGVSTLRGPWAFAVYEGGGEGAEAVIKRVPDKIKKYVWSPDAFTHNGKGFKGAASNAAQSKLSSIATVAIQYMKFKRRNGDDGPWKPSEPKENIMEHHANQWLDWMLSYPDVPAEGYLESCCNKMLNCIKILAGRKADVAVVRVDTSGLGEVLRDPSYDVNKALRASKAYLCVSNPYCTYDIDIRGFFDRDHTYGEVGWPSVWVEPVIYPRPPRHAS